MKALSVVDVEKMELQNIEKPEPKEGEVLIEVAYVGVCGSDLARYFKGQVHSYPQILGHEFSGKIAKIGPNTSTVKVGDRVTVAPLKPCGDCEYCAKGFPSMCTNYSFIGSREPGAMAEYVAVPEGNVLVIPDDLTLKEAAIIEPLTVAIHGIDRLKVESGDIAMVLGSGTIGLLTIAVLKARGVKHIIATDIKDSKLEFATKMGANVTINTLDQSLEEYFKAHELPNLVYETAGSSITHIQAIKFASKLGQVCFIGTSSSDINFSFEDFEKINRGELSVTGSWMSYSEPFPGKEWTAAITYLTEGNIDVKQLITGIHKLEDVSKPFHRLVDNNLASVDELYEVKGE